MRAWRVPRTCGAGCARAAPYDLHAEISRLLFVFWRRSYDRGKTLAAAEKARSRGRVRKAVRCYLKVLEHDPADHVVRSKVAPLLARAGRWDESPQSFNKPAAGYPAAAFTRTPLAVWTVAHQTFPDKA